MANPAVKRFQKRYRPIYDTLAALDLEQTDREAVAVALGEALDGAEDFMRPTFVLLASDPLCPCAGYDDEDGHHDCPDGTSIRIAMHNSASPDGRSAAWSPRRPEMRCVPCGAAQFVPGYRRRDAVV